MYIIKLGGSVITDKTKEDCFKQETMNQLATELSKANKEYILVHGAGSFGHILAKKYNLNDGLNKEEQKLGFSLTHSKVQTLNSFVLQSLHKEKIPAISIPPHATLKLNDHQSTKMDFTFFEDYLDKKFIPVTFGDVVLDKTLGISICSGDLLIQMLAEHFKPEKVIFVMDEDGIYSANPKTDKNAEFIKSSTIKELQSFETSTNSYADVTQGMKGKIDTIEGIAKMGIDTILLNGNIKNRLYDTLTGNDTKHTVIHGGK